jgi:Flp pilus assembly protein TadD
VGSPLNRKSTAPNSFLLGTGLFFLTFIAFSSALFNGFVSFDDPLYVTANPQVQSGLTGSGVIYAFTSNVAGNWHPLTMLSHLADCQLFGLKPWGHHLTSVLIHAANTVLFFLVFWRMTGARWRSFAVALLFGLHPLRVESVAWIAERKDVLSLFFALLTLLAYARYTAEKRRRDYWLAWLSFAAGLMSKPMLVTLPFLLILLDYWPLKRWETFKAPQLFLEKIPFFLLTAADCVITMLSQRGRSTVISLAALPLPPRIENAFVAASRYLGKFFYPADLCVYYPHPVHWPLMIIILSATLCLTLSAGVWLWRRRYPYLFTGWFWFAGTLIPVIGLVQVGEQSMADRYTYLPMIGMVVALVWLIEEWTRPFRSQRMILSVMGIIVAGASIILTWRQIRYWHDSETLFRHATHVTENNYVAYDLLAAELSRQGRLDEAIHELQTGLRLKPETAVLHADLGDALAARGRTDDAMREYAEALRLNPGLSETGNKLGMMLSRTGREPEAIQAFQTALQFRPEAEEIHFNLGNSLARSGRLPEAASQFQAALALKSDDVDAHNNLGAILFQLRQLDAAITEFQTVLKLDPANAQARKNLETALRIKNRTP